MEHLMLHHGAPVSWFTMQDLDDGRVQLSHRDGLSILFSAEQYRKLDAFLRRVGVIEG